MADLSAPDRYVPAFEALAKLTPAKGGALVRCIESLELFRPSSELERAITDSGSPVGDPELVTGALTGALSVLESQDPEEISEAALALANSSKLSLTDKQRERLAGLLERLLTLPQVITSAKAESMLFESERLFLSCRIVTDIRPVFGWDVGDAPQGAMLRHMLRVDFLQAQGGRDAIFIALDSSDLGDLEEAIERASRKADSVKGLLSMVDLPLFEIAEDDDDPA